MTGVDMAALLARASELAAAPDVPVMSEATAKRLVIARSGDVCECCGAARGESFSHRQPKGLGGLWTPENGLRTCGDGTRKCHGWIEANPRAAELKGWRVRSRVDPALFPVLHAVEGRIYLTRDGGFSPVAPDIEEAA